jgi:hypothetical protein
MLLKKYSDFGGGKKNLIQSFCHITLMLNSGKKFARLKKFNILTRAVRKKKFLAKKNPYV